MNAWKCTVPLLLFLCVKQAYAATYGNECNAQTDPCAATDHQACVVEDCYKCRCETGYHYVASSNSCTKDAGHKEVASVVTIATALLLTLLLHN